MGWVNLALDGPDAAATALESLHRLVDLNSAVRRTNQVETYLHQREWITEAARLLNTTPEALAAELVQSMTAGGAITIRDGLLCAAAEHTPVAPDTLSVPMPRTWPIATV